MNLHDRIAIVTGGGRGIGKIIALRLAKDGAHVVVAGPKIEDLEAVQTEIQALGRQALAVVADVTREIQVQALADMLQWICLEWRRSFQHPRR